MIEPVICALKIFDIGYNISKLGCNLSQTNKDARRGGLNIPRLPLNTEGAASLFESIDTPFGKVVLEGRSIGGREWFAAPSDLPAPRPVRLATSLKWSRSLDNNFPEHHFCHSK